MPDQIDKYLPEFDEDEARAKLSGFSREQLLDMLVYAYKEKRLCAKMADEERRKLDRMRTILSEPSTLLGMPGVPTADDLRRMTEEDNE